MRFDVPLAFAKAGDKNQYGSLIIGNMFAKDYQKYTPHFGLYREYKVISSFVIAIHSIQTLNLI